MQTERRIAKCAVLAALVLLGGACTKIDAVRSDGKQTQEAVMAAASAAEVSTTAETTTAATTETTTTTVTTTVTTTTAAGICQPFIDENANIDPSKPMVALTFDDGPGQYTNSILDTAGVQTYPFLSHLYNIHTPLKPFGSHQTLAAHIHC